MTDQHMTDLHMTDQLRPDHHWPEPVVDTQALADASDQHHHGYHDHKAAHLRRLKRIEGQARGLQRMVEEDKYCIDILTQVSAMTSALESLALALLNEHLGHCVAEAVKQGGDEAEAKVAEAMGAITRLVKS